MEGKTVRGALYKESKLTWIQTSKKPYQGVQAFLTTFPGPFEGFNAYSANSDLSKSLTFTVNTVTSGNLLQGQHIKKQRHYFANKGPSSQSYGFSSSHV